MSDTEVQQESPTSVKTPKSAGTKSAGSTPKPKSLKAKAKVPAHPKYGEMLVNAINTLKERSGSSRQAILKFMMENYKLGTEPKAVNTRLKAALKAAVESGMIKQSTKGSLGVTGSFSISSEGKAALARAAKKATARKENIPSKTKKPATKPKKTTTKPKAAAAKKTKSPAKAKAKTKSPKAKPAAKKATVKKSSPAPKKAKASKPRSKSPSKKTTKTVKAKKA